MKKLNENFYYNNNNNNNLMCLKSQSLINK